MVSGSCLKPQPEAHRHSSQAKYSPILHKQTQSRIDRQTGRQTDKYSPYHHTSHTKRLKQGQTDTQRDRHKPLLHKKTQTRTHTHTNCRPSPCIHRLPYPNCLFTLKSKSPMCRHQDSGMSVLPSAWASMVGNQGREPPPSPPPRITLSGHLYSGQGGLGISISSYINLPSVFHSNFHD
jgi:hypothetical protein